MSADPYPTEREADIALQSASAVTIDVLFEQAGVIRTDTLHELARWRGGAYHVATASVDGGAAICSVAERAPGVAIAAVFMTMEIPPASLRAERAQVPGYEFPEDAARAVARAARHGRWRARPQTGAAARGGNQPEQAAAIISEQLADAPGWMSR